MDVCRKKQKQIRKVRAMSANAGRLVGEMATRRVLFAIWKEREISEKKEKIK